MSKDQVCQVHFVIPESDVAPGTEEALNSWGVGVRCGGLNWKLSELANELMNEKYNK